VQLLPWVCFRKTLPVVEFPFLQYHHDSSRTHTTSAFWKFNEFYGLPFLYRVRSYSSCKICICCCLPLLDRFGQVKISQRKFSSFLSSNYKDFSCLNKTQLLACDLVIIILNNLRLHSCILYKISQCIV